MLTRYFDAIELERFPIRLNRAARIKAAYVADCLGGMCNLIGDCSNASFKDWLA
jgi:hypothetical protein